MNVQAIYIYNQVLYASADLLPGLELNKLNTRKVTLNRSKN